MMSLKDKGNESYKQSKFQEAIHYYREYTREDHSDNKNAFNNMGLSYYKLKEYQLAAEAFENAIQEDRQYEKPYYWLVQVYKQMKDCEYQILINATHFLKYSKDQKIKAQIMAEIKEQKEKISYKKATPSTDLHKNHHIFSFCQPNVKNDDNKHVGSMAEWTLRWKQSSQTQQQKWRYILDLIKVSPSEGFNVAYLFSNSLPEQARESYIQKIRVLKAEQNNKPEPMCEQVNETTEKPTLEPMIDEGHAGPQTSSEEQNLFETPVYEKPREDSPAAKIQSTRQPIEEEKPAKQDLIHKQKPQEKEKTTQIVPPKQVESDRQPIQEQKPQKQQASSISDDSHTKMNIQNARQLTPEEITRSTLAYMNRFQKSRDVITESFKCTLQILESNESSQTKAQLISNIRTKREVDLAFKTFTKTEKSKIEALASRYSVPISFTQNKR